MTPFRISKLEINNIGSFGNLVLDFPEKPASMRDKAEIHILTGENGTGKTTILEALVMMLAQQMPTFIPKSRFTDEDSNIIIEFQDSYKRKWYPNIEFMDAVKNHKLLSDYWGKSYQNWQTYPFSIAFFAYSSYRKISDANINAIQESHNNPLENALNFENSISTNLILQWIANIISKEALAKSQGDILIAQKYRHTLTLLETAISKIIDKPLRFYLQYEPLKVNLEIDNKRLIFNVLPDGLKSIISWLSDLLMRMDRLKWVDNTPIFERNFILFLDEIDVHLHPSWQRKILPAIQSLFPNAQIFVSTHSPFVVGSLDGVWIHKLVKPNGDTKLAEKPILSEDSRSVWYWLREVFDINEEFGQEAQQDLDKFYLLRDALLVNGTPTQRNEFKTVANALVNQNSKELETIVAFELRQLNKKLTEPISL
jgi:predicted ATP-binding protein involved in virulence